MKRFTSIIIFILFPLVILAQENYTTSGKSVIKHISFQKNSAENYIKAIPNFQISNFLFVDDNNDQTIEAEERSFIRFSLLNVGDGLAKDVKLSVSLQGSSITGLEFEKDKELGDIYSMREKQVSIAITGRPDLVSGVAGFRIDIWDDDQTNPDPFEVEIPTKKFSQPNVVVANSSFCADSPGPVEVGNTIFLKTLIQNVGEGNASQVQVEFILPSYCSPVRSNNLFHIGHLNGGAHVEIEFPFKISRNYEANQIPIDIVLTENYELYAENKTVELDRFNVLPQKKEVKLTPLALVDQNVDPLDIENLSDVDLNIPRNLVKFSNRLALVIGNHDYEFVSLNKDQNISQLRDALVFKDYLIHVLGFKEDNIFLLTNATSNNISNHIELLSRLASRINNAEIFIYFSGLGFIDTKSHTPCLLPINARGEYKDPNHNLFDLIQALSQTRAKKINLFLDATFILSGEYSQSDISLYNEKVNQSLTDNTIVYCAAKPGQLALGNEDGLHGLFTYHLLKNLKETQGKVSYGGIGDIISRNVSVASLQIHQIEQDPDIFIGKEAFSWWRNFKFNDY